jgi:uncharacterized protein YdhG (YjbR/CyaY superfamily)
MATAKPKNIDEYIEGFPEETQKVLKKIRTIYKKLIPGAEEVISYGIPCFNLNGTYVAYFAGYAKHVSIYPAPVSEESFIKAFEPYKQSKGTVQFPLDGPIPYELIERIVKHLLKKNSARSKGKEL